MTSPEFLGRGWAFPIDGPPRYAEGAEKIAMSIRLILSTAKGERPMRPGFGAGIHDQVFAADSAALRGVLAADVRDALTRWEPRVDVLVVDVEAADTDPSRLLISISCRIRANNAALNIVYPYVLNEGVGLGGGDRVR
uniref:GPW/gp25 family protein n=1 Tax=Paractinoplanes polyasparticus TaxID=2856853 RepID=UPI001C861D40|nr:GPW/gp25 family protein [Actinoplanes polyasparticus]